MTKLSEQDIHIRRLLGVSDEDDAPDVDEAIRRARMNYKYEHNIVSEVKRILGI
jgi:hypothetical protein